MLDLRHATYVKLYKPIYYLGEKSYPLGHSKIITKGPRWKLFWKVLSNFFGYYVTWHMSNMKFKGSLMAYYALPE